jgi:hypothetical protein
MATADVMMMVSLFVKRFYCDTCLPALLCDMLAATFALSIR